MATQTLTERLTYDPYKSRESWVTGRPPSHPL